ncbi:MAG: ribosome-binding factor A [Flavobacteriales bacterium]
MYICRMESTRQQRISSMLQKDMAELFQLMSQDMFKGTLITVTKVRISPDLGVAKIYLSLFPIKDKEAFLAEIDAHKNEIRHQLAQRARHQMRKIPELNFFIDDSLDYEENIDRLLKEGGENPIL